MLRIARQSHHFHHPWWLIGGLVATGLIVLMLGLIVAFSPKDALFVGEPLLSECIPKISFSVDGQLVAAATLQGTHVWQITDGRSYQQTAPNGRCPLAWSPTQSLLVMEQELLDARGTLVISQSLQLWQAADASRLTTWPAQPRDMRYVAFSPDGQLVVAGDDAGTVWLRHVPDGTLIRAIHTGEQPVRNGAFLADGQTLLVLTEDAMLQWWRISDGSKLRTWQVPKHQNLTWYDATALSADGAFLALTVPCQGAGCASYMLIEVWRVADGTLVQTLSGPQDNVFALAFSPDERLLAAGTGALPLDPPVSRDKPPDNMVRLWSVADGQLRYQFAGHAGGVKGLAFSPDQQMLASIGEDGYIRLWSLAQDRGPG
jgi:WD40 repeat protein